MSVQDELGDAMDGRRGWNGAENALAFVELALRTRGVRVEADALQRAHRVLNGTLTREQAREEIAAKYGLELPGD